MYTWIADCGIPLAKDDVILKSYSSTLENSPLEFGCKSGFIPDSTIVVAYHRNACWIPGPNDHVCTMTSTYTFGKFRIYDWMIMLEMCTRPLIYLLQTIDKFWVNTTSPSYFPPPPILLVHELRNNCSAPSYLLQILERS